MKVKVLFTQLYSRIVARQAPLSMGFFQVRILQWVAIPFSRRSSWSRDQTQVSCISCPAGGFFTIWAHQGRPEKACISIHMHNWITFLNNLKYSIVVNYISIFLNEQMKKQRHSNLLHDMWICLHISSVQSLSHVRLLATPWTVARQAFLSITNSWSPPKPMSIESMMPYNHLILCRPLLLLPSIFPSIRSFQMSQLFASGGQSIGVSASASVLPMNIQDWSPLGRTGWISLQSKGLSKSLLQHHSSKASILRCSAFFTIQLSQPYMTTGKTIALTRWTFVGKAMSLLFNMLSRLVITFLPRSKRLLISWLQSPSAVIFEPPK